MTTYNFDVIERAGISQDEFAQIMDVSRTTAHNWIHGKTKPHRIMDRRLQKLLSRIEDAVEHNRLPGKLPPTSKYTRTARHEIIRAALQ